MMGEDKVAETADETTFNIISHLIIIRDLQI